MSGKVYDVAFGIADDGFSLGGATRPEDLSTQMQVLAAYVTEPGWRTEPFNRTKAQLQNIMSQIETRPINVAMTGYPRLVRSNDARWGLPKRAELNAAILAPVRSVLDPALARAPIEVVIVGDVTVDQAIAQTAATFGALPTRAATAPRLAGADRVKLAPAAGAPARVTHSGRPDVGLGLISWRTDDFFDNVREARVLQILQAVVQLRALDKLREELGSTYSPVVTSETSEVFNEIGMLTVAAEVKQDTVPALMSAIEEVASELVANGPTTDELNRARAPILATLAKDRAGNEYWLGLLSGATWDPRRLDKPRTAEAHLNSVTVADLKRTAAAYVRPERAWRMVVDPSAALPHRPPLQRRAERRCATFRSRPACEPASAFGYRSLPAPRQLLQSRGSDLASTSAGILLARRLNVRYRAGGSWPLLARSGRSAEANGHKTRLAEASTHPGHRAGSEKSEGDRVPPTSTDKDQRDEDSQNSEIDQVRCQEGQHADSFGESADDLSKKHPRHGGREQRPEIGSVVVVVGAQAQTLWRDLVG